MPEERVGEWSHLRPCRRNDHLWNGHRQLALDDESNGTSRDGGLSVVGPIRGGAWSAEEQCPVCDSSRVVREVDDVNSSNWKRRAPRENGTEEVREQHYGPNPSPPAPRIASSSAQSRSTPAAADTPIPLRCRDDLAARRVRSRLARSVSRTPVRQLRHRSTAHRAVGRP